MGFRIGENQAKQQERKDTPLESFQPQSKFGEAGEKQQAQQQLDDHVAGRNARMAVAAASAQPQPAKDGNIVISGNLRSAIGARRARGLTTDKPRGIR